MVKPDDLPKLFSLRLRRYNGGWRDRLHTVYRGILLPPFVLDLHFRWLTVSIQHGYQRLMLPNCATEGTSPLVSGEYRDNLYGSGLLYI